MAKTLHIKVRKSESGGPRGSDPIANPWIVLYRKGENPVTALGRWPTKNEAFRQASKFADAARRRGFTVDIGGTKLSPR